jgi:hypothetical protein
MTEVVVGDTTFRVGQGNVFAIKDNDTYVRVTFHDGTSADFDWDVVDMWDDE